VTVNDPANDRAAMNLAMSLSLAVGVLMLLIKVGAYWTTSSSAILGDAAESVVHVLAVFFAAYSLRLSFKPADSDHPYGHAKISFFSAGFEGAMIIIAAVFIFYDAIHKWLTGITLEHLSLGTALIAVAAGINGILGGYLLWVGKQRHSIVLEANGKHVLTDCWTSIGVVVGLILTILTGWVYWDTIFALIVAANILVSGFGLVRRSIGGLMDTADPEVQSKLESLLEREVQRYGITFHHLRHRNLGYGHWVEVHLLFPDAMAIKQAHRIATEIEQTIESALQPAARVTTHLEAQDDHDEVHLHDTSG
jgi:cation diffusion facilitator family transporter